MPRIPILTLALCFITLMLAALPETIQQSLYFTIHSLESGRWIGAVTGHWIHVGNEHLLWNVTALAVLGAIVEQCSRRLLLPGLLVGTACVDLLLLSPVSDISQYCGLSGILNTLLGIVLFIYWQKTRSRMVIAVGILSLLKIIVEIALAESLFTSTTWPPYALAHLAGLAAAPVALYFSNSNSFIHQCVLKLRKAAVRTQRNDPTIQSTYR